MADHELKQSTLNALEFRQADECINNESVNIYPGPGQDENAM